MQTQRQAFTLVELIVVIVIVSILGTIGFVSYNSYLPSVRDTNRIAQMENIYQGMVVASIKGSLPTPSDAVEVKDGSSLLGYQGYMKGEQLDSIHYSKSGKDPQTHEYFVYYLSPSKKKGQLLGYLEESIPASLQAHSMLQVGADYENLYPYSVGDALGVVLQDTTNEPLQDVVSETSVDLGGASSGEYSVVFEGDTQVSGSGNDIVAAVTQHRSSGETLAIETSSISSTAAGPLQCMDMTQQHVDGINEALAWDLDMENAYSNATGPEYAYYDTFNDLPFSKEKICNIVGISYNSSVPFPPGLVYLHELESVGFGIPPSEDMNVLQDIGNMVSLESLSFWSEELINIEYIADLKNLQQLSMQVYSGDLGSLDGFFDQNSPQTCQDDIPASGKRMCVEGNGTTIDITITNM